MIWSRYTGLKGDSFYCLSLSLECDNPTIGRKRRFLSLSLFFQKEFVAWFFGALCARFSLSLSLVFRCRPQSFHSFLLAPSVSECYHPPKKKEKGEEKRERREKRAMEHRLSGLFSVIGHISLSLSLLLLFFFFLSPSGALADCQKGSSHNNTLHTATAGVL